MQLCVWCTQMHGPFQAGTWPVTLGRSPPHSGEAVEVNLRTAWWLTERLETASQPSQLGPTGSHYSTASEQTDRKEDKRMKSSQKREKTDTVPLVDKEISWHRSKAELQASERAFFFPPPSLTNWFGKASGAGLIKRRWRSGYGVELALFEKHSMQ